MTASENPRRDGLLQALGMAAGSALLARGGVATAWVLTLRGLAAVTLLLALTAPTGLAAARRSVGRAVTAVLLAAVYITVLLPTRALMALARSDPWASRAVGDSYWIARDPAERSDFRGMS